MCEPVWGLSTDCFWLGGFLFVLHKYYITTAEQGHLHLWTAPVLAHGFLMVPWVLCTIWTISGQRSTFWNLLGLMLYLCGSGFGFLSYTFWRVNFIVYWVSVHLYGSYEYILIDC